MGIITKMPAFDQVTAGQTSTCNLPIGRRYHNIFIPVGALTASDFDEIRISANSDVFWRCSGTELDIINGTVGLNTIAAEDGIFINFDRDDLLQRAAMESTAINTGQPNSETGERPILSLQIEIDVASGATITSANTLFAPLAEQSPAIQNAGQGAIKRITKYSRSFAAAGTFDIDDLPFNSPRHRFLEKVYFQHGGNMSELEIRADNAVIFEKQTQAVQDFRLGRGARTKQTNTYIYDTTLNRYGGNILDTAGMADLRFVATLGATQTVEILLQNIGSL